MLRKMAMARIKKQKDLVKVCGCAVLGILYIGFASLSTFVHLCASLCIFVHHCASLCIIVHLCASLCIIVHRCASLCIVCIFVHMHVCVVVKVPRTVSLTMFLCHILYI